MKSLFVLALVITAHRVRAHGDHGRVAQSDSGSAQWQYAQRHMASEHHIDSFDLKSFFHIHDLNRDGIWDKDEIEAIYGVHHIYSQKKSKDEVAHQEKADHIVNEVLSVMDKNKDGKITPEEFEASGLDGLPNFDALGAEGHHYDVESEFFLHHEELYHSTPETQTDESYSHPEDIEHFAQHEEIERQEAIKEAQYQGISVEEALAAHESHPEPPSSVEEQSQAVADGTELENEMPQIPVPETTPHPHDDQAQIVPPLQDPPSSVLPKITRQAPPEKQDPILKYKNAKKESGLQSEWGTGESGYSPPKTPAEKMRKNLPYKYKFRRNWGDF